jgi:hypothetical protein
MKPSYLTRSPYAWGGLALIAAGFAMKYVAAATGLPVWLVPVGYFGALFGAAILFVGWIRWKAMQG